jgi:hypothetical protein
MTSRLMRESIGAQEFIHRTSFSFVSIIKNKLLIIVILFIIIICYSSLAQAVPPPLSEEELFKRSDLIIEGHVIKIYLYDQWLNHLKSAGAFLKDVPATAAELVKIVRNFPFKKAPVVVDGVYIAEVKVDKWLKGNSEGIIYIPFVTYHFIPGQALSGPWSERRYLQGEYLKMYLQKNGPFFESTWWNGVQELVSGKI